MKLSELTQLFLKRNGMTTRHLADSTEIRYHKIRRWLIGDAGLTPAENRKVHAFLRGKYFVSTDQIMREEREEKVHE